MDKWINKLQQFRISNKTDRVIAEKTDTSVNDISKPDVKPQIIASAVSEELEDNAIISVDSGTSTFWAARYINIKNGMKFSVSGTLASMACGLPYAIAAQIAYPERQCVAFVGDGGFMMLMATPV
jgi:thiamine pyrophosphate-dependent acetolactate synthase large subunit-like protein